MRRVVITGLGCVTPFGVGVEKLWSGVVEGRSAIRRVTSFDATGCGSQVAGEVPDFNPEEFLARREIQAFARFLHFGVAASRMAWDDAGCPTHDLDPDRVGVFIGSAVGATDRIVSDALVFHEKGLARIHPMFPLQYAGACASEVAIVLGLRGPAYAIATGCTAGADAIGLALGQIGSGMLDAALVGGSEAPLIPVLFASFDRLRALSTLNDPPERACRPFARERNGFVLSEGAGMLLLEAEEVARARAARVYARLAGFGATCDAYHHLAPAPDGEQGARAVRLALAQAGLAASEIDYVNAHGTGTPKNDVTETMIMKSVFGERARRVPISSTKSMLGHLIGASGAVELIVCVLALRHGVIPPTANMGEPDPDCDLDYVSEGARQANLRTALSPSFGFGARNAALALCVP